MEEREEEEEGGRTKGRPDDYLPERKKYEQLCRGEGLRMVRREKHFTHLFDIIKVIPLLFSVRLLAGRAASSAVTTTTIDTRNT